MDLSKMATSKFPLVRSVWYLFFNFNELVLEKSQSLVKSPCFPDNYKQFQFINPPINTLCHPNSDKKQIIHKHSTLLVKQHPEVNTIFPFDEHTEQTAFVVGRPVTALPAVVHEIVCLFFGQGAELLQKTTAVVAKILHLLTCYAKKAICGQIVL